MCIVYHKKCNLMIKNVTCMLSVIMIKNVTCMLSVIMIKNVT